MHRFVSAPLEVPVDDVAELADLPRADIVLYGLDHSGPSYEARVFLNTPEADLETRCEPAVGYAGSAFIFGHGACYGEPGHCDPRARAPDPFERRLAHPLEPWTASVIATKALTQAQALEVVVTVFAVDHQTDVARPSDALEVEHVRLLLFER